jgi:hypothetical protein
MIIFLYIKINILNKANGQSSTKVNYDNNLNTKRVHTNMLITCWLLMVMQTISPH